MQTRVLQDTCDNVQRCPRSTLADPHNRLETERSFLLTRLPKAVPVSRLGLPAHCPKTLRRQSSVQLVNMMLAIRVSIANVGFP